MARTADSFKRKDSKFLQVPTILVVCEDLLSGKNYLEDAAVHFRANAKVEIMHCGLTHPKGIVEYAIGRQKKFDKVFCAIDRDTHESFEEALMMARAHEKVNVIASYPCFEYWLLLHFGYTRKPYTRSGNNSAGDNVGVDLRGKNGMADYVKSGGRGYFKKLLGEPFKQARLLSPRILEDAFQSGDMNPSTQLHLLIDEFESISKPKPVVP
ncbi:RloB family protein [Pseudomonas trivialis]|uniref:RloB family protein n=1 Tax=Pseudomonas trivialis TaxID=200450 RepID=UPI0030CACAF9